MNDTTTGRPIHFIPTHPDQHIDELATIWGMRNIPLAETIFPGISTAPVIFWRQGGRTPDGKPAATWEKRGYYLLGVGGGDETDEHANKKRPRREGESAFSLFIKQLGLENAPWLKGAAELITKEDLVAGTGGLAVPNIVKEMNWQFPEKWEYVMEWAMMGIGAIMKAEMCGLKLTPDDHAYKDAREKVRESLHGAAEVLGCLEQPWLQPVIDKLMANLGPLCLPYLFALLEALFPEDREEVEHWLAEGVMAVMTSQQRFFTTTREEYLKLAGIVEIEAGRPQPLKMATIVSDNRQISKYALSKRGGGADVAIIKNARGNVRILSRKDLRLEMRDVIRVIRIREREVNGCRDELPWSVLEGEGLVPGASNWIIHLEGRMVLNGSTSAPDVPPTKLTFGEIIAIIKDCLNPKRFDLQRQGHCLAGTCATGRLHTCPLDRFGLLRCREIRGRNKAEAAMRRTAA
jgi:hypothetical protein